MEIVINATFDGEIFRPFEKINLIPNSNFILKVKPVSDEKHPLKKILDITEDMGVKNLSENHYMYSHSRVGEDLK